MGLAGSHAFATTFTGDASLVRRPMGRVLDPLRRMGVQVIARAGDRLPATVKGPDALDPDRVPPAGRLGAGEVGAAARRRSIRPASPPSSSRSPTRDHTERMLTAFGAAIEIETAEDGARTHPPRTAARTLKPQVITVPGDPSSAAFTIVAALIVEGSDVTIENVLLNPTRTGLIETLLEMGGDISHRQPPRRRRRRGRRHPRQGEQTERASRFRPARAPSMIDEYPVLAVAAAFAEGDTLMEGHRRDARQGIRPHRRGRSPASRPTASPPRKHRNRSSSTAAPGSTAAARSRPSSTTASP